MIRDTTKPAVDVADAKRFDDWFELIETDRRAKVRGFIDTMIAEAFVRFPAHLFRFATALDLDSFARFEILGQ
jgi:hypothetical protein